MYTNRSSFGVHTAHVGGLLGGLLSAGGSASAAAVSDSAKTAAVAALMGIHRLRYCMGDFFRERQHSSGTYEVRPHSCSVVSYQRGNSRAIGVGSRSSAPTRSNVRGETIMTRLAAVAALGAVLLASSTGDAQQT